MVDIAMAMLNCQMVHLFFLELDGVVNIEKWIQNSCGASWCVSTLSILSTFKSQISYSILFNESYCLVNHMGWERTNRDCHSSLPGCSVFAANSGWFSHQTPTDSPDLTIHDWPHEKFDMCPYKSWGPRWRTLSWGSHHSNFTMVYGTQITNYLLGRIC